MVAVKEANLLPSLACHSASEWSSSGSQDPVLTGRPLTVVGIGMADAFAPGSDQVARAAAARHSLCCPSHQVSDLMP